jgi:two-component system cell cycle response regulator DivK
MEEESYKEKISHMKTILAIDDEELNLELISKMLEREGFRVILARSADEGLALLRDEKPELILMDIKLQGMDGLQTTRLIKADPALASIPIVAASAYAMPEDLEKAREAGCSAYLTKPFGREALVRKVRELI